jgi:predicted acetyltransferase
MSFDVRPVENLDEFRQAVFSIGQYAGDYPTEEGGERFARILPFSRMLSALEDGQIVGGAGAFPFEMSVPGGRVPCCGTTVVGVYPTHRRRGALRAMMRAHIDQARELGEPIAALWASEETIYGRYGYGRAGYAGDISIPRERVEFAQPFEPRGRIRIVEPDEALEKFPALWDALAEERPGVFTRTPDWWEARTIHDPPERRHGAGPKRFALLEHDEDAVAYAIYRHSPSWENFVSTGKVRVVEAIGRNAQATIEVWRYLLDIDWVATIESSLIPPDHPVFFALAEPRRARYRVGDSVWVRLLDVGAALSARTYARGDELVFELRDEFCPWNEGRWRLADGVAERTEDAPDLRCDVAVLGSLYLGGVALSALAQANLVEELTPGAIARADGVFRHGLHPWCPEIF